MVNVFGQEEERDGRDGKDALPITTWFPDQVLQWWRNQSDAVFYFNDPKSGFIYTDDKITGLKNQNNKFDAIAEGKIGELEKHGRGYSLHFKDSLYSIPQISLAQYEPMTSCLTVSFFVPTAPTKREYIISTNINHSLSIDGDKIQVWGCVDEPTEIPLLINRWNIVFVQWKVGGDFGGYVYHRAAFHDDTLNEFVTTSPSYNPGLHIGKNFNGQICAIDITNHTAAGIPAIPTNIPIEIRDLLTNDHFQRPIWS